MLAEREANPGLDHGHAINIELEECVHFHLEDWRFVWTMDEFRKIASAFRQAEEKAHQLGFPNCTVEHHNLGHAILDEPMHSDRLAVEITSNGTLHLHNKSMRLHMYPQDFYDYAEAMREAQLALNQHHAQEVNITDENIAYHSVTHLYLKWLDEYLETVDQVNPTEIGKLADQVRWHIRHPNGASEDKLQRPDGHLPKYPYGQIPEDLNRRYLACIYESIKEWGYASGPFEYDYMPAYKLDTGKIYLKGAHRTAALVKLGYTNIKVVLTDPPSGWK